MGLWGVGRGVVVGRCFLTGGVKVTLLGVLFNVLLISGDSGSEKHNLISESLVYSILTFHSLLSRHHGY